MFQMAFHFKDIESDWENRLKDIFEKERDAVIKKHLGRLADKKVYFHITVEKNPHKNEYIVGIALYLPSKSLYARRKSKAADVAMNAAINSLVRQVDKYRDKFIHKKGARR